MMYKRFLFWCFLCAILLLFPSGAFAETQVTDGNFPNGATWTKEGSPYILESYVTVPKGASLNVGAGVAIMSASTTDGSGPYYLGFPGNFSARGTEEEPVRIIGLDSLSFTGSTIDLQHVSLEGTGINITSGTTTIDSSSMSGAGTALTAKRSFVQITNSDVSNNTRGILSNLWTPGPFLSSIVDEGAIGGIGNAEGTDTEQNVITVTNTSFENNQQYSILNKVPNPVYATDDWWGSSSGPTQGTGGMVSGPVIVDPWKTKDPHEAASVCCSNVLFIPGIQASRLYQPQHALLGTGVDELWEPDSSLDVEKLYLNASGSSTNSSVYTSDIIDTAFGLGIWNIYKQFIGTMNGLVMNKTINEWLPFAYDWRMNVSDIANGNTQYSTTTKSLITEFERLAHTSKTGKVTLLAHSNGGLVSKMLGQALQKKGESNLIDKVILVASPQLGTPEAIAALLYGDNQALAGGLLLSAANARTFGLNMPGAYGLLPSPQYFKKSLNPVLNMAGKAVTSYASFIDFLTGKSDQRKQPKKSDLADPAVLNSKLIAQAQSMHSLADLWQFPTTTEQITVSGWGVPTTDSLSYDKNSKVSLNKTLGGDGTVVVDSSEGLASSTVYFNLGQLNHDVKSDAEHANILEANPLRKFISELISTGTAALADIQLPQYMSFDRPVPETSSSTKWIAVSVHSPVSIDAYDSHGGHIGLIPLKNYPGHSNSNLEVIDNTIGGQYEEIAGAKYIYLPEDSGQKYSIQLKGTGSGLFTYEVQRFDTNFHEIASSTYSDLPVTPLLLASTTVDASPNSAPLLIDADGDGVTDTQVLPATTTDPLVHLNSMRAVILALHLRAALEKSLLGKIDAIKLLLIKGKKDKIIQKLNAIEDNQEHAHWNRLKLTAQNCQKLADMYDALLDSLNQG